MNEITKILFLCDLVGIVSQSTDAGFNAPEDEYEPEAKDITGRLGECKTADDIRQVIVEVFNHWFGNPSYMPEDRIDVATERIWFEYQKSLGNELPAPAKRITSKWSKPMIVEVD